MTDSGRRVIEAMRVAYAKIPRDESEVVLMRGLLDAALEAAGDGMDTHKGYAEHSLSVAEALRDAAHGHLPSERENATLSTPREPVAWLIERDAKMDGTWRIEGATTMRPGSTTWGNGRMRFTPLYRPAPPATEGLEAWCVGCGEAIPFTEVDGHGGHTRIGRDSAGEMEQCHCGPIHLRSLLRRGTDE